MQLEEPAHEAGAAERPRRVASTTCSARPGSRSASRRSAPSSRRGAAFGDGAPQSYVDGFHDALWVGAAVAAAAAAAAALLIRGPRRDAVAVAGDVAVEAA